MSLADLQDAKEQVRQAVDIVDLVGGYLTLRRQGRNYVGLCPWHDDSRPSMQVNPERQSFKCWVCDIGGDIFTFLMRMEGLEFRETLEMLADRAGIELSPRKAGEAGESQFERRNLLKALAWAEEKYHQSLLNMPEAEPARRYLQERGISAESIKRFNLGFSPPDWEWLVKSGQSAGFSPAVLERIGCAGQRESGGYYDRFRGRLMFSIRDVRSRPIAFGGRVLPEFAGERDAKYINSPETPLFSKSRELYALDLAREGVKRESGVLVMEGYTDVIMAHQHGIDSAVAVLGTALGEHHVPLIKRFTDEITLVLDGDAAGQTRTMDILDNLLALFVTHEINLKVLGLPQGCDPCDVILSQGSEAFRALLAQSQDALTHKMDFVMQTMSATSPTAHGSSAQASTAHLAAQAVESILATLARALPGGATSSSSALVREQQVLVRLARTFGMAEGTLRERLKSLRSEAQSRSRTVIARLDAGHDGDDYPLPTRTKPTAWDRELLEVVLAQPEAMPAITTQVSSEDVTSGEVRELYLIACDLHEVGVAPTFEQMMLATNSPELKSLLVDCDELNAKRSESDPQQRLGDLFAAAARRREEARHQSQLSELRKRELDPEAEDELLRRLFQDLGRTQDAGRSQSGSSPTEG